MASFSATLSPVNTGGGGGGINEELNISSHISPPSSPLFASSSPQTPPPFPPVIYANMETQLKQEKDWEKAAVFTSSGILLAASFPINQQEILEIIKLYDSRDRAIARGLTLQRQRFEVHRWHPPLIYGRRGSAEDTEGFALARGIAYSAHQHTVGSPLSSLNARDEGGSVSSSSSSSSSHMTMIYLLITFKFPIVAPLAIQQLTQFFKTYLGDLPPWNVSEIFRRQKNS